MQIRMHDSSCPNFPCEVAQHYAYIAPWTPPINHARRSHPNYLEVDVPSADDDAGKNTSHRSRVLSDESSADTSTGGGTTVVGEVKGEYPPLPVDHTFNYSASSPNLPGGGDKPDGDNDD